MPKQDKGNVKYKLNLIINRPKEGSRMTLLDKKLTAAVLYSVEGAGAVFVVIFLAAYLGGIPTTTVLHKYLAFRIPLAVLGGALLILILAGTVLAAKYRK